MYMKLKVTYFHENMEPLVRKHAYDAGADVPLYKDIVIETGKNVIPLGFNVEIPPGFAGFLYPRSSVMGNNTSYPVAPIDSDYTGEFNLVIYNPGDPFILKQGTRLCQLVIMPVLIADFTTDVGLRRSDNGLGSTGR